MLARFFNNVLPKLSCVSNTILTSLLSAAAMQKWICALDPTVTVSFQLQGWFGYRFYSDTTRHVARGAEIGVQQAIGCQAMMNSEMMRQ